MLSENLINLRNINGFSQEEIAEKVNVTRQAYAKWEKGESVPDIERCALLAKVYNVSIDSLYKDTQKFDGVDDGLLPAPDGKHIFGTVTMNEKGQIVIPKKAREILGYKTGENLLLLGDEEKGLAIIRTEDFIKSAKDAIKAARKKV
ncbi:MAG: helix-turn-helix domain-containing protein [Treponema sp.]|nr:helix-turn-helix domain-containing protein [Candidatus Treponema caballi]